MEENHSLEQQLLKLPQGDRAAFEFVYESTKSAVYGFILSIVRNREDAEDIMHDTYLRIYNKAADYKPLGKPLAWILTIARNLSFNRLRSTKPVQPEALSPEPAQESFQKDAEDRMLLEALLNDLEEDERQIVMLHVLTGWKHREIAEWMNLPLSTVISKYNRSLKKMKKGVE